MSLTCQLVHGEVRLDLVFVHDARRQRLLGHLPVVDLLLHRALGKEPVDVHRLCLPEPEHPEDALDIVRGVPRGVKDDDPVGRHQVDPQTAGLGGDQEQTHSVAGRSVEELAPDLPRVSRSRAVHPVVVLAGDPGVQVASQGGVLPLVRLVGVVHLAQELFDQIQGKYRLAEHQHLCET